MSTAQVEEAAPTPTSQAAGPTSSPIPIRLKDGDREPKDQKVTTISKPIPKPTFPQPKLRFQCHDLTHPGALAFFDHVHPVTILSDAVVTVLQTLYEPFAGQMRLPTVRSITLILRPMGGVAYTTGNDLDDEHKEIHFSLDYISSRAKDQQRHEIHGVLVHEMVHVWQHNAQGTCPGGLVEGVADYVRLRAGLSPGHWNRTERPTKWDQGYQHTGYFLDWLESRYGSGKVTEINAKLRDKKYEKEIFWEEIFGGKVVEELFDEYLAKFET